MTKNQQKVEDRFIELLMQDSNELEVMQRIASAYRDFAEAVSLSEPLRHPIMDSKTGEG